MSVWSFQGGMEFVTEFRAEGHCFIDKNLPTKKASKLPKVPQLGAEPKLKTRPRTHFLDTLMIPLCSVLCVWVCFEQWRGTHGDSPGSQPDSSPHSAPDPVVLNLTKHDGCFFIYEMGEIMQCCLWAALLWDQRRIERRKHFMELDCLYRYQEVLIFSSPLQSPRRGDSKAI